MSIDDDLDLSAFLPPVTAPADGAARARRSGARRRASRLATVAGAVCVLAVGAVLVGRDGSKPTHVLSAREKPLMLVLAAGPGVGDDAGRPRAFLVDLRTNAVDELHALAAQQYDGIDIGFAGDTIVLQRWPATHDLGAPPARAPLLALDPPYSTARQVADAFHWHNSIEPGRLWIETSVFPGPDGESYPRTLNAIDLRGRVTRRVAVPCCRSFVADTERGLLFSTNKGLELRDRTDGRVVRTYADEAGFVAAVEGDRVILIDSRGCGSDDGTATLLDLASGSARQVGDRCRFLGASFSPGGDRLVLRTSTDGAGGELWVYPGDGRGQPQHVPDSNSADWATAWDGQGRLYYADLESHLRSFDPTSGRTRLVASPPIIISGLSTPG